MKRGLFISMAVVCWWLGSHVFGATFYVDASNASPVAPFTNWTTAANVLQDAVDVSSRGDIVLVTNGIYASGGRRLSSFDVTNRVVVTNGAIVQSVNGPAFTFIQGYQVPTPATLSNAIRCAYLGSTSVLSGFTLTNGSAGPGNYVNGGGVLCARLTECVISNCIFIGNYAMGAGGGLTEGKAIDCIFTGNYGQGGGAADGAALVNCIVTNNTAGWAGGTLTGTATNCLFAYNHATNYGGGCGYTLLVNCTVVSNYLQSGMGGNGGGTFYGKAYNSIVFGNTAPNSNNYFSSGIAYSCTSPTPAGPGNFSSAPQFMDASAGDFRLATNSPCINAGQNAYAGGVTDLAGNPRITGGTVDVGAYEFQNPLSAISYNWLQQNNLPVNGTTDLGDPDQDGASNWQEWRAGTAPNDKTSALKMAAPVPGTNGITISWQSVSGISYSVQRCTNLAGNPPFITILSNVAGQPGTTSVTDTDVNNAAFRLYRVTVN